MHLPLGRLEPVDMNHVDKYSLRAMPVDDRPVCAPVVMGTNWYEGFDAPIRSSSRRWWIGTPASSLGRVRGGHAYCLLPAQTTDPYGWWSFYDQGTEGACVGFACSRMMSLLNRRRYDARWLYRTAQQIDEWPGTDYEGTSVRAGLDILRQMGHREVRRGKTRDISLEDGIVENRWATSADEVLEALGTPHLDYVTIMNSWGRSYPHFTRMPADMLERLIRENGEAAMVTDRR